MSVGTPNGTCQGSSARSPNSAAQDLPVAGLRHQRHQQHRPQRRRHRHRPPRGALDLPPRHHLRRHLADRAGLPGHLIQLLLDDPEPGVISGMPAGLHPPVAADHRRRDRHRLAGTPPGRPVRIFPLPPPSARSGPPPAAAGAAGDRRSAARTATIPAPASSGGHPPGTAAALAGNGTAGYKDTRDSGDQKGVSTSSLTGSPSRKPATTGKTLPACRAVAARHPTGSRTVTASRNPRQPAKQLIYMALGARCAGGNRRP